MKIEFDRSFYKSLDNISENKVLTKLQNIINEINNAGYLSELKKCKEINRFQELLQNKIKRLQNRY